MTKVHSQYDLVRGNTTKVKRQKRTTSTFFREKIWDNGSRNKKQSEREHLIKKVLRARELVLKDKK